MRAAVQLRRGSRGPQAGYVVLMIIFLVASLAVAATVAAPNLVTQGRREIEQEMIWRGNQYVRAIRLYYQKNGRFPQTLEELSRPDAAGVHYLRKAYRDPMNAAEDGNWRAIYVAPSGQLIGSVRYRSLQEMAAAMGLEGQLPSNLTSRPPEPPPEEPERPATEAAPEGEPGAPPAEGQQSEQASQQPASESQPAAQQTPAPPAGSNQAEQNTGGFGSGFGEPQPAGTLEPVDGPVLGGAVIGVASKVERPSLRVYQGGKTYLEWEFIWNPMSPAEGEGAPPVPGAGQNPAGASRPAGAAGAGLSPQGGRR